MAYAKRYGNDEVGQARGDLANAKAEGRRPAIARAEKRLLRAIDRRKKRKVGEKG